MHFRQFSIVQCLRTATGNKRKRAGGLRRNTMPPECTYMMELVCIFHAGRRITWRHVINCCWQHLVHNAHRQKMPNYFSHPDSGSETMRIQPRMLSMSGNKCCIFANKTIFEVINTRDCPSGKKIAAKAANHTFFTTSVLALSLKSVHCKHSRKVWSRE